MHLLVSFFDATGTYRLARYLEEAYRAGVPNQFQKDFIEVDKRVNLLYSALEGKILRIFPVPNHNNNKWVSYAELDEFSFSGMDSLYVKNILPLYFNSLRSSQKSGDYNEPNKLLESLKGYQEKFGSEVVLSDNKIKAEVLYNKYDIFKSLFSWYLYAGVLLFIVLIVQIFNYKKWIKFIVNTLKFSILALFIIHTVGLIARWFISGHAPWSDAYESMIYVAWATMFLALFLGENLTLLYQLLHLYQV